LTTGLLVAYPNDQRLIKAKALIEKLLAPAGSANTGPSSSQPTNAVAPAQPKLNTSAESLTGMEKIDYNALVELARQAQQTTDLQQQNKLLQQFMDQSSPFLQKHPDQTLLWQLRAASAISLNDPTAGYAAGQKLLAAGVADSNDPALQRLLGQLKNKGWLDKQEAERQSNYVWILGTWTFSSSRTDKHGNVVTTGGHIIEFSGPSSDSYIEGYTPILNIRINTPDSGAIRCEHMAAGRVWKPASCQAGDQNRSMRIVFTALLDKDDYAFTWLLSKN
jgi:hypothetical protein